MRVNQSCKRRIGLTLWQSTWNCLMLNIVFNQAGLEDFVLIDIKSYMEGGEESKKQWFVMRDLKRSNAKLPAYKQLADNGFRVFTPITSKIVSKGGKNIRIQVPFIQDLLFVFSEKEKLDRIVDRTDTLQYRYVKGAPYCTPMVVPTKEMDRFIAAVADVKTPRYYAPNEITPTMYGADVKIVSDGALNGYEGKLLKVKGSGKKRIIVELPGLLAASVEVGNSDYIEIVHNQSKN